MVEGIATTWGWTVSKEDINIYLILLLFLLGLVFILIIYLNVSPLAPYLPEAGMVVLVGALFGSLITYVLRPEAQVEEENNLRVAYQGVLSFEPTTFFVVFLPPIVFYSGYGLRRDLLFRHIFPISLFACLGTLTSAIVIAAVCFFAVSQGYTGSFKPTFAELMTFGSLISATDPVSTLAVFQEKRVDPHLFVLVFGESVLNDAVGILLFNAFSKFIDADASHTQFLLACFRSIIGFLIMFIGSALLGLASGLVAAYIFRVVEMRYIHVLEISLYILIMYVPFFLADIMELSGIVCILFTGISAKSYTEPNLSDRAQIEAEGIFHIAANMAETCLFLEMGLSIFGLGSARLHLHIGFIFWAIVGCIIGRWCCVYPYALLHNVLVTKGNKKKAQLRRESQEAQPSEISALLTQTYAANMSSHISLSKSFREQDDLLIASNLQHMMWFSGLRGAVAYACAKNFPDLNGTREDFVYSTIGIVLFTIFVFGSTTEIVLKKLHIPMNVDDGTYDVKRGRLITMFLDLEQKYILPNILRNDAVMELENSEYFVNTLSILSSHSSTVSHTTNNANVNSDRSDFIRNRRTYGSMRGMN